VLTARCTHAQRWIDLEPQSARRAKLNDMCRRVASTALCSSMKAGGFPASRSPGLARATGIPTTLRPTGREQGRQSVPTCTGFAFLDQHKYRENRQSPKRFCNAPHGPLLYRVPGFPSGKRWVSAFPEVAFISRVSPVQVRPLLVAEFYESEARDAHQGRAQLVSTSPPARIPAHTRSTSLDGRANAVSTTAGPRLLN
jgi:hypothetical protein